MFSQVSVNLYTGGVGRGGYLWYQVPSRGSGYLWSHVLSGESVYPGVGVGVELSCGYVQGVSMSKGWVCPRGGYVQGVGISRGGGYVQWGEEGGGTH